MNSAMKAGGITAAGSRTRRAARGDLNQVLFEEESMLAERMVEAIDRNGRDRAHARCMSEAAEVRPNSPGVTEHPFAPAAHMYQRRVRWNLNAREDGARV